MKKLYNKKSYEELTMITYNKKMDSKRILDYLAKGVDPLTGESLPSDHLLNDPLIVRALWEVKFSLENIQKNYEESGEDLSMNQAEEIIFLNLKKWRLELAREKAVNPYIIIPNNPLIRAIKKKVKTKNDLQLIKGFGPAKIQQYGEKILKIINKQDQFTNKKDIEPLTNNNTIDKFIPKCNIGLFSEEEQDILEDYGYWMESLVNGKTTATSDSERIFINAAKNLDIDKVDDERYKTYIKYLMRLKIVTEDGFEDIMRIPTTITDTWISRDDLKRIYPHRKG